MTWDYDLFLWLNFDGGAVLDWVMQLLSAKLTWVPLYLLLLYMVWREGGVRSTIYFALAVIAAVALSDMVAGIFKHTGLLKHLWESFPVRLRPMHTPQLEGLIHVLSGGGKYGTVSAHAATTASIALIAAIYLRRRWLSISLMVWVIAVSYSRIYLAFHFPQDILIGWAVGILCAIIPIFLLCRYKKI